MSGKEPATRIEEAEREIQMYRSYRQKGKLESSEWGRDSEGSANPVLFTQERSAMETSGSEYLFYGKKKTLQTPMGPNLFLGRKDANCQKLSWRGGGISGGKPPPLWNGNCLESQKQRGGNSKNDKKGEGWGGLLFNREGRRKPAVPFQAAVGSRSQFQEGGRSEKS